jgi:hypothetical protein
MKRNPEKTTPDKQVQMLKVVVKETDRYLKTARKSLKELEQISAKIDFILSGKRP